MRTEKNFNSEGRLSWVVAARLALVLVFTIAVAPNFCAVSNARAGSNYFDRTADVGVGAKAKANFVTPAQRRMRQQQRIDPNTRARTASREGGDAKRPQLMVYDFGHGWAYKMTAATQRLIIQDEFLLGKMDGTQTDSKKVSMLQAKGDVKSNRQVNSSANSKDKSQAKIQKESDDDSDERFRRFVAMDSDSFIDADGYRIITHDEAYAVLHGHEVRYKLEVLGMNLSAEERNNPRPSASGSSPAVSYDLVNYALYRDRKSPNTGVPVPLVPIDVATGRRLVPLHSKSPATLAKTQDRAPSYMSQTSTAALAALPAEPLSLRPAAANKPASKKKVAVPVSKSTVKAWKGKDAEPIAAIPVPNHLTKTSKAALVPKKALALAKKAPTPTKKSLKPAKADERQHVAPDFHTPYADLDSHLKTAASKR